MMTRILAILLCAMSLAHGATLTNSMKTWQGGNQNLPVTFTPLLGWTTNGTDIVNGAEFAVVPKNGLLTATNVQPGLFKVTQGSKSVYIAVPTDSETNTYWLAGLITNGLSVYSYTNGQGQAVKRIIAGTNIVISPTTGVGDVTINSTSTGTGTNSVSAADVLSIVSTNNLAASNLFTSPISITIGTTNKVVLSDAGTTAANGTYTWNGSNRYTNGTYYIALDTDWFIYDGADSPLYIASTEFFPFNYTAIVGEEPAPSGTWGSVTETASRLVNTNSSYLADFQSGLSGTHLNFGASSYLEYGLDPNGQNADHKDFPSANIATVSATNKAFLSAIIGGRNVTALPGNSVVSIASSEGTMRATRADSVAIASEFFTLDNPDGVSTMISGFRSTNNANASSAMIQDSYGQINNNSSFVTTLQTSYALTDGSWYSLLSGNRSTNAFDLNSYSLGHTNYLGYATNSFLFGSGNTGRTNVNVMLIGYAMTAVNSNNIARFGWGPNYIEAGPNGLAFSGVGSPASTAQLEASTNVATLRAMGVVTNGQNAITIGNDYLTNSGSTLTWGGTITAGSGFTGNGSGISGVIASSVAASNVTANGTVPLAALPSAVVTNSYTSTFSVSKDSAAAIALGTTANASSFITFNNNRGAIGKNGDFIALMGDASRGIKLMTGVSPSDASGGTAYLEIAANGATTTLRSTAVNFSGSATVTNTVTATNFVLSSPQWTDLIGIPQYVTGGANPALTAITNGSAVLVPAYQQNDLTYWQFQLPHNIAVTNASFALGTATNQWHLEPHCHFVLNQNATIDATHSNVTFQCTYRIADINGNLYTGTNTATKGVDAVGKHYIVELGAITNGGPYGISAILSCELKRIASSSQDLSPGATTRDVGLIGFDLHCPVGNVTTIGSRGETSQ